jgi:uncharacterized protein (DUF1330 family)
LSNIADQTFIEYRPMADLPNVNAAEIAVIKSIAQSNGDGPVLMLNLNKYRPEAGYPDGKLYTDYMAVLGALLLQVGGKVLWRSAVLGHVVGNQDIDEALGIWYPSHQAFLDLMTAPASGENMRLRALAVARADLHRCGAS